MHSLPADYHVHTAYCGHAQGKAVDYVEAAIQSGMKEICFSDHLGRYYLTPSQRRRHWDWGMDAKLLGRYLDEIDALREAYADRITIRAGLEIDYIEGAEDILVDTLSPFTFDFLLASIHCLPSQGWKHLSSYGGRDSRSIYDGYFQAAQAALHSGLFDSLAHLDFIWRYVKWPDAHDDHVAAAIRDTVAVAHETHTALEINANAFLWSLHNTTDTADPFALFLEAVGSIGVAVTIGSDAHRPEFVGKAFPELARLLKNVGVVEQSTYANRKKLTIPL